jgi:hypothetical protein
MISTEMNPKGSDISNITGTSEHALEPVRVQMFIAQKKAGNIRPVWGRTFLYFAVFYKHGKPSACLMVDKIKRRRNDIKRQ